MIRGKHTNWEPLLNCSRDFNSLKEDTIYENIVKRGAFWMKHSEQGTCIFYILSTLLRVCFSILCSSIGTKLTWKRPPPGISGRHCYNRYLQVLAIAKAWCAKAHSNCECRDICPQSIYPRTVIYKFTISLFTIPAQTKRELYM